jgi:hypothetical protein
MNALVLLVLAFIFPLGIYCLILGALNRRERPLLVSGRWDFAGVLFATSGFLLFVGPAVLRSLYERWRFHWLLGVTGDADRDGGVGYSLWLATWYVYYVAVIAGSAWMLKRRGEFTAVYNLDRAVLEVALARVLERLGVSWRRAGNHFFLKPETLVPPVGDSPALEIETFAALNHATLRWHGVDEPSRQGIERELDQVLAGMPPSGNSVGGWFISLGASILFVAFAGAAFVILLKMRIIGK